ncbi:MAG: hypothetical protein WD872_16455 [Pirellulaceae bacterium]
MDQGQDDGFYRRYEVLLPLRFNDGSLVPDELIEQTLEELRQRFGALSRESQPIEGHGSYFGKTYRDDLLRVFVDVPDTAENRQFFLEFKEHLKARFAQLDIWVTTHPLEIL